MTKPDIDFAADGAAAEVATPGQLESVKTLVQSAIENDAKINLLAETLKLLGEAQRNILENLLPDAMHAANLKTLETPSGFKVTVKPFLAVSLAGEKKAKAIAWLEAHDHGGLISRDILLTFKKGQDAEVEAARKLLSGAQMTFDEELNVNTATFKSLLSELIANKQLGDVKLEDIGAYSATRAEIKPPKKRAVQEL